MKQISEKRILSHLARLRREGEAVLHDRPPDELAQAKWSDRVDKYLTRTFPQARALRPDELLDIKPPDLLDWTRKIPSADDAARARTASGALHIRRQLTVLARVMEQVEMHVEQKQDKTQNKLTLGDGSTLGR